MPVPEEETARVHLEQLRMIQCSLLPGEAMTFLSNTNFWEGVLDEGLEIDPTDSRYGEKAAECVFLISVEGSRVGVEVRVSMGTGGGEVSVRDLDEGWEVESEEEGHGTGLTITGREGGRMGKEERDRWLKRIEEGRKDIGSDE